MDGPRAPKTEEMASLLSFLDQQLRPGSGWSIRDEYPTAFLQSNFGNIRIITDQDKVLSHAVIRPLMIKAPAGFLKVAAIGSVVTDSEHRKKGLSKKILEECVAVAKDQGNDFAILWTDLYDFYRQFGFELAGSEVSILIDQDIQLPKANYKFLDTNKIDPSALYRIFTKHTVATIRTIEEIKRYMEIPNSRVYTAWNEDGTLAAYAVEGKGADLNGYVHEWGGNVSPLLHLFNYIRAKQQRNITVLTPAHSVNLIQRLYSAGFYCHHGYLGMIKILNPKYLFPKITRHAHVDLGIKDFVLEEDQGVFRIGIGANTITINDEKELTKIILGPYEFRDRSDLTVETQELLKKILPTRLWIWGWDSI